MSCEQKINYIQRSPHDKINPFVMINKTMLRDPSLTPRAKGILCYLLSFTDDVKVDPDYISLKLEITKDSVYKILNEIIDAGYAFRTEERECGRFKSHNYYFTEFKINPTLENEQKPPHNESEPFLEKPELVKPELEKPDTAHIHTNNTNKQQPQTPSDEKDVVVVFSSLQNRTDLSDQEKQSLMTYPEDRVIKALDYCTHPDFKLKTTLVQALHWHCKLATPLAYSIVGCDKEKFLKSLKKYDGKKLGWANISVGPNYIEFVSGQTARVYGINDKDFIINVNELIESLTK